MSVQSETVAGTRAAGGDDMLSLELSDVTETHQMVFNGQRSVPADAVARVAASRMSLPENVPWSLLDSQGSFLDGTAPIGDQVQEGARLWVSPMAHLG